MPAPDAILNSLKSGHPRLLLNEAKIRELRELVQHDATAKRLYADIKAGADKSLKQEPTIYELRDGRRLIYVSNKVLKRVQNLAFMHLMTSEKRYAERAWLELKTASEYKDWNPDHFLDTAILTKAFAIGSDWLWDVWTPDQREILRRAIVVKGLQPAMKVYASGRGWAKGTNNWNQVCNGGIGMGALAVADTDKELAGEILHHAIKSIPIAMSAYAPDGAGYEGPGYWSFGSLYNIMLISSLETALGTDFGLAKVEGFRQSGDYPIYLSGAKRIGFDFGDANPSATSAAQHLWMGQRYGIPRYTWFRQEALSDGKSGGLWDLIWLDGAAAKVPPGLMSADKHFRNAEVVTMRDSWNDDSGFAIAMQGGDNAASHRHLDLGSFILEADGIRWILDSGKEKQTYHKHRHGVGRNDFYRVRAEGHNTLVVNPDGSPDQDPRAKVAFTDFVSAKDHASVSIDLSAAHTKDAMSVNRSFRLDRGSAFTVSDRISCAKPSEIWSFFHTRAEMKLAEDGKSAILSDNGKTLRVMLTEPSAAVFRVLPAEPFPGSPNPSVQTPNNGLRKLAIQLEGVKETRITVRFQRGEIDGKAKQ
ncbi:MAG: heparinase II/III family protein [Verrucomicrobiales bacterium]